jgi:hypothetical protein
MAIGSGALATVIQVAAQGVVFMGMTSLIPHGVPLVRFVRKIG